jgi:aryl-alcohol dehydrogenase-like predicted oxidoreductase
MGMSFGYTSNGGFNEKESLEVLTRAADLGINHFDTSDIYVRSHHAFGLIIPLTFS